MQEKEVNEKQVSELEKDIDLHEDMCEKRIFENKKARECPKKPYGKADCDRCLAEFLLEAGYHKSIPSPALEKKIRDIIAGGGHPFKNLSDDTIQELLSLLSQKEESRQDYHVPPMIPRKEGDMRPVDKNGFFV